MVKTQRSINGGEATAEAAMTAVRSPATVAGTVTKMVLAA
jgi:hypothetical protein